MSDPTLDGLALVFQERFWSDRDAGEIRPLADYLALFPGHDELIAAEYVTALDQTRSGEEDPATPPADESRIGPYRLLRELGRGGQGLVWLAEDTNLGRRVALKTLTGLGPDAQVHVARFRREAAVAARLDHPGICGVHDAGIEGGIPYIAMRYVEGKTLAQRVATARSSELESELFVATEGHDEPAPQTPTDGAPAGRDEIDQIVSVFEKAARALHAAHEAGIVHRDIKPGNIMVTLDGEPVILDFGLARDVSEDAGPALTVTNDFLGTPAYMSPEQVTGAAMRIDRRTDVFALGVSLFECLTLKRPFDEPTRQRLLQAIATKAAPDPRRLNPAIPNDLRVILECALEKDRDRRYQTAAALADDLAAARDSRPIAARPIGPFGRMLRFAKRRPAVFALTVALTVLLPAVSWLLSWTIATMPEVEAQRAAVEARRIEGELEQAYIDLNHGDRARSRSIFERLVAEEKTPPEAVAGLCLLRLDTGRAEEALGVLERHEEALSPETAALLRFECLGELGRTKEAETPPGPDDATSLFIAGAMDSIHAHDMAANSTRQIETYERARRRLEAAIYAAPIARRIHQLELAHVVGHLDDKEAAERVRASLRRQWPDSLDSRKWRAFALQRCDPKGCLEESLKLYEEAPRDARIVELITISYLQLGPASEGERWARKWVELAPRTVQALSKLGVACGYQGKFDEALEYQMKAYELRPGSAESAWNIAITHKFAGRLEEALPWLHRVLELDPQYPPSKVRLSLAKCLGDLGRHEEAIHHLELVIDAAPDDVNALFNLGVANAMLGRDAESLAAFSRASELAPEDPEIHRALGLGLLREGRLAEAVQQADRIRDVVLAHPHASNPALAAYCIDCYGEWIVTLEDSGRDDEVDAVIEKAAEAFARARNALEKRLDAAPGDH